MNTNTQTIDNEVIVEDTKAVTIVITLIIVVAFVLSSIGVYAGTGIDYDHVKNLFLSSLLILLAIVFIENTERLMFTCSIFSGIFIATGLYLIWMA